MDDHAWRSMAALSTAGTSFDDAGIPYAVLGPLTEGDGHRWTVVRSTEVLSAFRLTCSGCGISWLSGHRDGREFKHLVLGDLIGRRRRDAWTYSLGMDRLDCATVATILVLHG